MSEEAKPKVEQATQQLAIETPPKVNDVRLPKIDDSISLASTIKGREHQSTDSLNLKETKIVEIKSQD